MGSSHSNSSVAATTVSREDDVGDEPAVASQAPPFFCLLDLRSELWLQVLSKVIPIGQRIVLPAHDDQSTAASGRTLVAHAIKAAEPAIGFTGREVREEAQRLFYRHNTFVMQKRCFGVDGKIRRQLNEDQAAHADRTMEFEVLRANR